MKYTKMTKEKIRQDSLEQLAKMRPLDDDLMRELFRNNLPLAQFVLRIITGKDDLVLTSQETQYDMKRLLGTHSICLDVLATDSNGEKYNLKIQSSYKVATPQRARYHSSSMDIDFLNAKEDFSKLPITYTIFITENDVRDENRAIYNFELTDCQTGKPLGDGAHIIYVNGAYTNDDDNSDIAKLIHDFRCTNADDMYFELMADTTRYYKQNPKGVSIMCKLMEDRVNETAREAKKENSVDIASKMLSRGKLTIEEIAEDSGLALEEVNKLAEQIKANA